MTVESPDSPLGRWTAAHWAPPPGTPLHGAIERIWYFDGTAELIVMLDERHRDADDPALASFPAVCINGCRTQPSVVVSPHGRCRVLSINFTPVGACTLLRSNMQHLVDVTVDVRDAIGLAAEELGERCADAAQTSAWNGARNATAVLAAAVQWLQPRVTGTSDAAVHWAFTAVRHGRSSRGAFATASG